MNDIHLSYEVIAGLEGTAGSEARTASTVVAPYFRWKTVFERALAILLLIPGLPMIGVLVCLVRLTSRGPGIYEQVRVGKGGRSYTMYKIRTMTMDAEDKTGPVWTKANDPRIMPLGRILRRLHLDELPQLFNVVKGNMALIGPRPERPEFVEVLAAKIPNYRDRLSVLPGVTGLAQINLPPDTDLDSVRRKLILDLQYISEAGWWLDVRMLACTFPRMTGVPGCVVLRLLGLHREAVLPPAPVAQVVDVNRCSQSADGQTLRETISVDITETINIPESPQTAGQGSTCRVFHNSPDAVARMAMLNRTLASLQDENGSAGP